MFCCSGSKNDDNASGDEKVRELEQRCTSYRAEIDELKQTNGKLTEETSTMRVRLEKLETKLTHSAPDDEEQLGLPCGASEGKPLGLLGRRLDNSRSTRPRTLPFKTPDKPQSLERRLDKSTTTPRPRTPSSASTIELGGL